MFWFFARKVTVSLALDAGYAEFGKKLSGKVTVVAKDAFVSGDFEILLNWNDDLFINLTPFVRKLSWSVSYVPGQVSEFPFEIDFATRGELDAWYAENCDDFPGNRQAFDEEVSEKWFVTAYLHVPGFDAICEQTVSVK